MATTHTNQSAEKMAEMITEFMGVLADEAALALSPRPGRIVKVAPGETVAWDNCCDGQLTVRLSSLVPNETGRQTMKPGTDACAVPFFLATFEIEILRCAAVVNDSGVAPSAGQINANGVQGINDMTQLLAVLRCNDAGVRSLTGWTPQGPEGGCHGGFWTFTMLIPNCITCEAG